jgi:hypothetical protein
MAKVANTLVLCELMTGVDQQALSPEGKMYFL